MKLKTKSIIIVVKATIVLLIGIFPFQAQMQSSENIVSILS